MALANNGSWTGVALVFVALCAFGSHLYAEHQAYKTGVYMGRTFFTTKDFQNRRCLSLRADCEVPDLNQDSAMEDALASANIIPALADSVSLRQGFRDGWRQARTAVFGAR